MDRVLRRTHVRPRRRPAAEADDAGARPAGRAAVRRQGEGGEVDARVARLTSTGSFVVQALACFLPTEGCSSCLWRAVGGSLVPRVSNPWLRLWSEVGMG